MLHRIKNIISIAPYTVICEWTNGEIRAINMEEKLKEWAYDSDSVYKNLLDKNIFKKVKLDKETKTLFWDNLIHIQDAKGNFLSAPLDIDPETLYQMSTPANNTKHDKKAAK